MIVSLLALAMMRPPTEIPTFERGATLYKQCLTEQREMDGAVLSVSESLEATHCLEYLQGYTDAWAIAGKFCPPEHATNGTILRVYVLYMQKNPKLMDNYRSTGLTYAIDEAYPCPAK